MITTVGSGRTRHTSKCTGDAAVVQVGQPAVTGLYGRSRMYLNGDYYSGKIRTRTSVFVAVEPAAGTVFHMTSTGRDASANWRGLRSATDHLIISQA